MWEIEKFIHLEKEFDGDDIYEDKIQCWKRYGTSWKDSVTFVDEIDKTTVTWQHQPEKSYGLSEDGNIYYIKKQKK